MTHSLKDTLGCNLEHSLLEGLGGYHGLLGNGSVAGSEEELLVAGSRIEEFLGIGKSGALGPLGREHVGSETSDVRRGHTVRKTEHEDGQFRINSDFFGNILTKFPRSCWSNAVPCSRWTRCPIHSKR